MILDVVRLDQIMYILLIMMCFVLDMPKIIQLSPHYIIIDQRKLLTIFRRALCEIQANQSNSSPLHISQSITLNKAHVIKITKGCTVAFMKARNSLIVRCREKYVKWKKTEDGENLFFKAIGNRFWLTSKSYLWFNKVVHGQPSIKRTS